MTAALLVALAALQVLDGVTTRRVLDQGGRELNPVMRAAFAAIGFWPVIAAKGAALVLLAAWMASRAGPIAPAVMTAFYAALVAWNWRQGRR